MEKQNLEQDHVLSLLAEIVLEKALRDFEIRNLYDQIDHALQEGDETRFLQLTEMLNLKLKENQL